MTRRPGLRPWPGRSRGAAHRSAGWSPSTARPTSRALTPVGALGVAGLRTLAPIARLRGTVGHPAKAG
ncbi:hypothetical protein [Streptosporangium saharense]|uniref:hypothetical protein n=1 Tax=Streptosporangium saharense TaxID=1706840 RepID=UPI00341A7E90